MSIPAGKIPIVLLDRLLGRLPSPGAEVLLGPAVGEDACAIEVDHGTLIAATDPITLTGSEVGRYAVLINANDVAVMGVRPRWFLAAVLLPVRTVEGDVETLFADLSEALEEVGAVLVGGHTEVTDAVRQPVVVGQMLGFSPEGRFVSTEGARPGDVLIQVGAVPIEGAAVLAASDRIRDLDPEVLRAAARATEDPGISVVEAALEATELGATSLHDPTEGGLASGLHELAQAARVALTVHTEAIRWFGPGLAVCEALGCDPWATIASGSLLATFPPEAASDAVETLAARGHTVARIGVVAEGEGVADDAGRPIPWPERDEVARIG